ncbi:hypothetical protein UPYG_G00100980 [Umbra pygmaea]|uniref:Uncharacterized protein n=1 Tax=Umbra pygmaea TaxID=75934 RepID=A0ABD0XQF3_UMBPY
MIRLPTHLTLLGWCRMSAMHWEARRRQDMVDRRMARARQQKANDSPEPSAKPQRVSDESTQQPVLDKCPNCCKNQLMNPTQYNAKVDNRYSSTQYSQQW